jgi:hypothetical protein
MAGNTVNGEYDAPIPWDLWDNAHIFEDCQWPALLKWPNQEPPPEARHSRECVRCGLRIRLRKLRKKPIPECEIGLVEMIQNG